MSMADDVLTALQADDALVEMLTGGIFIGLQEINRHYAPAAFDENKEILPCALIKFGNEIPMQGYTNSVQTPFTIYIYQRFGYDVINPALDAIFDDLNWQKIGAHTWNVEFDTSMTDQRDDTLDCALGTIRFVAKRIRI